MSAKIITTDTFDEVVLKSDSPVLVDFWGPGCVPCKMLAPVFDSIAEELDGEVVVCKVDTSEEMELAQKYGVMMIPTVIAFKDGEELDRTVGVRDKSDYIEMVK